MMTDVEDRLRQAMAAEAKRAQPSMLRPLRSPVGTRVPGLRWPGWVAPLAAAAAVIAVVAGTAATSSAIHGSGLAGHRPGAGSAPAAAPGLGQAKNFDLSVLGRPGQRLSLASLAGRPVIVSFFASWCAPCQKQTPRIARFYRAAGGRVLVIGIDVNDSAHAALSFIHTSGITYPVAVDLPPGKTATAYHLPGLPATFFLNSRHTIVKRILGPVTKAELASGTTLMTQQAG
jgi:cytochrome c biogenesis protein CcmG/thiol:disulfide interchange protein DsbE